MVFLRELLYFVHQTDTDKQLELAQEWQSGENLWLSDLTYSHPTREIVKWNHIISYPEKSEKN